MNINTFFANMKSLQMSNRYSIKIIFNDDVDFEIDDALLNASANSVSVPKKTFDLDGSQNIASKYEIPVNTSTSNLSITFIADGKGKMIKAIDDWMNYIQTDGTSTYKFLNQYSATIFISLLDTKNEKVSTYKLISCYPITISDLSLDNKANSNLEFTVTLHCERCIDVS